MTNNKTRTEHLEWCKQRALEYLDTGQSVRDAIASMLSDLNKHNETKASGQSLGPLALSVAMQDDRRAARDFIEGFH